MAVIAPVRRNAPVMGSVASVHVYDDVSERLVDDVIARVFDELDGIEAVFSTFRPDSEISRINAGSLHVLDASREVVDVLDACTYLEAISDGAFSSRTTAGSLDPAGFVKGWAVERASRLLADSGLHQWYVSLGGDMQMGEAPESVEGEPRGWKVGIADPRDSSRTVSGLLIQRGAVATSGTGERGRHLIDPRTGTAADYWASVTVVGPSLTWADAYATVACVRGKDGLAWVHRFEGYSAVGVTHDGRIVTVDDV